VVAGSLAGAQVEARVGKLGKALEGAMGGGAAAAPTETKEAVRKGWK
jgi:hypothetical protein